MENIIVLILAGGKSKRLWPFKKKHFLPFLGRPLVYYCLKQLENQGFKKVVIVVNDENKPLFGLIKEDFSSLTITLILQKDKRGMAGAVLSSKNLIKSKSLLIIGPSDIYDESLYFKFNQLLKKDPQGIIAGIKQSTYFPGGYLTVSGDCVTSIVEKPKPQQAPSDIVTFVFHYFKNTDKFISLLENTKSKKDDIYELCLSKLVAQEKDFKYLAYQGFWGYIKLPWHILNLNSYFLSKIRKKSISKAYISPTAIIKGEIIAEDGVVVLENAKVIGPCYLGKGTIIGNNSVVRESAIGRNCVIGVGTEVVRSYISNDCWFHSNYVGDSIVGQNVSMGAGAVLANFRLDETIIQSKIGDKMVSTGKIKLGATIGKNVRIGINSSIMPGIKIGRNSFVGAGVTLSKDLPEDKFCSLKSGSYLVRDNKAIVSVKKRFEVKKKLRL